MAYREVRMMDIDQVMRRWLVGEGKLQAIRQGMGRPGAAVAPGEAEQRLQPRTDQIRVSWRAAFSVCLALGGRWR